MAYGINTAPGYRVGCALGMATGAFATLQQRTDGNIKAGVGGRASVSRLGMALPALRDVLLGAGSMGGKRHCMGRVAAAMTIMA